ncbi:hypothetical protein SAMN05421538_11098 [Paracoccus isoporae]|uniref:Uncharacterized protein n=1 Tax=Paracoccus isoporae TaxID=591205 RepID=A0A1G7FEG2_9RHOB|nr:hypothetical protein [Paracoccus isoporae]SDE73945.1 hypothetical protein SAMN05421538_11098 [Paracoccus isoporae]
MTTMLKGRTDTPPALPTPRPRWLRLLILVGLGFILFNTLGVALFLGSGPRIGGGMLVKLVLVGAAIAVPLWKFDGLNVLRSWSNPAKASFTQTDDPATGAVLFTVTPARAARMPALPLFAIGGFLLFVALIGTTGIGGFIWAYLVAIVFIGVGCSFVLPGAADRRPADISVSPGGIRRDTIHLPLDAIADLRVTQGGLVIDADPLVAGPRGVSTAAMAGRHMGRRQSGRGFAVEIRAEGEGRYDVLAGGLTEDCAQALATDLVRALATARSQTPAASPVGAG